MPQPISTRPNKRPVTVLVFGLMAILTAMLVVHAAAVLL